jgi:hypothetical protein
MKRISFLVLMSLITLMAVTFFMSPATTVIVAQEDTSLTAVRVTTNVSDPFDAVWSSAPTVTVAIDPETEDAKLPTVDGVHFGAIPEVKLQAAYDDTTLWVRAVWPDDTMNNNFATWTYDGTAWTQNKLRQDRIAFLFDISGSAQFKALGCGGACHEADSTAGDYMGFPVGSADTLDGWQWKSSQTALVGYADDQWLGAYVDDKGPKTPSNDASTGTVTITNKNKAGDAPAFVYPQGAQPGTPLFADKAVPFDPGMKFEAGYTVPGYVVSRPTGSRSDVSASSRYVSDGAGHGWWYVVLSRALNTGNPEDHVFTLNSSNVFGVAVFNNADDKQHATKDKLILTIGS